mmetsp:Transcript_43505/g.138531  ORF Transcript_43505/g.138531 Transcript_43505/m.138531 type:complete len:207 (+) Transcript_43505:330-950(+)
MRQTVQKTSPVGPQISGEVPGRSCAIFVRTVARGLWSSICSWMPQPCPRSLTMTWLRGCPCRLTMQKEICCRSFRKTSRTAKISSMPPGTTREGQRCCDGSAASLPGVMDTWLRRTGWLGARELRAAREGSRAREGAGEGQQARDCGRLRRDRALCASSLASGARGVGSGGGGGGACRGPNVGSPRMQSAMTTTASAPRPSRGRMK